MFIIKKLPKKTIIVLVVAAVLLAFLIVIDTLSSGSSVTTTSVTLSNNDDTERANFLLDYGWEITTVPTEICEITIPKEFDDVYKRYNDLQKTQGFDLSEFAGKKVKRYTYDITNYPDGITILQYENKIIGGDICTMELDGFMHGFDNKGTGIMRQTMYGNSAELY